MEKATKRALLRSQTVKVIVSEKLADRADRFKECKYSSTHFNFYSFFLSFTIQFVLMPFLYDLFIFPFWFDDKFESLFINLVTDDY